MALHRDAPLQLEIGAADRLVALLDETGEPIPLERAACCLLALRSAPSVLAGRLIADVCGDDARLVQSAAGIGLRAWGPPVETPLGEGCYVVVDLETTGVGTGARIVEIGAVLVDRGEQAARFSELVDPGIPLPPRITEITGIRPRDLAGARPLRPVLDEFLRFAGSRILVAHNAPFDCGMLDRALLALAGRRLAARVLDTVCLARRLLEGRLPRFDLASLARRFDTVVQPCHRALPDAQATAELLCVLIGVAQERGIATVEELLQLAATAPARRRRARRDLTGGLPEGPGVYVMRDAGGQALYVGKATDLRSRVRSYFGSRRLPPRLAGMLAAVERIEVSPTGSELEAAIEENRLIQAWRPVANVRDARPDRYRYLRLDASAIAPALGVRAGVADDGAVYAGPFRRHRQADEAAEALRDGFRLRTCRPRVPVDDASCLRGLAGRCLAPCRGTAESDAYAGAVRELQRYLERGGTGAERELRDRIALLVRQLRFEEAATVQRRLDALAAVDRGLAAIRRACSRSGVLLAPDLEPSRIRAVVVADGLLVALRTLPRSGDPSLEAEAALASLARARTGEPTLAAVARGPWLPADRYDVALLLADAFAGRAEGVVALAGPTSERIAAARARVPQRAAVDARAFPSPGALQQVA